MHALPCQQCMSLNTAPCVTARAWDEAYEQLTYERGACNLVQKYTPQLVRDRVFAGPNSTWIIMVRSACSVAELMPVCRQPT